MPALTFTIPGLPCPHYTGKGKARQLDLSRPPSLKLVGYYTQGKHPNWGRLKEYHVWKDHVRLHAPPVPDATAQQPVRVDVWCTFESRVHPDPENVRKGIVDALFPGGDKYVYGYHHHPLYGEPGVRVQIGTEES